jgi:hypothetical protein
MTGAEQFYLATVIAAFAFFAAFVIRANKASEDCRKQ